LGNGLELRIWVYRLDWAFDEFLFTKRLLVEDEKIESYRNSPIKNCRDKTRGQVGVVGRYEIACGCIECDCGELMRQT
jgi:hypothetical protein